MHTLNCNGRLIDLSTPRIMGIINVTPDSFYDGGKAMDPEKILKQARSMLEEGATFLDIGGYSSRPGAMEVTEDEEMKRVLPAISSVLNEFPEALISVDTFRSEVADKALDLGAAMINDISGGQLDPNMMSIVGRYQVPYVMMHMRGTPNNMSQLTQYDHLTEEILMYFSERMSQARDAGINDLIADPGFGFAKNRKQNFELLSELELFNALDCPVLVGISRKSMIYKTLGVGPEDALNGTTALHMTALMKGSSILRVHDVKQAAECVKLFQNLQTAGEDV